MRAAIVIADAEGLEAVSIRRIAAELDVGPMSLYNHIADKAELLALMVDRVSEGMLARRRLPADWRKATSLLARRMHATLLARPWLPWAIARGAPPGPNALRHIEQMAAAVAGLGLEPSEVSSIAGLVDDYVLGFALRSAAAGSARDLRDALSDGDLVEFPELAALPASTDSRLSSQRFEAGLETILEGIERRVLRGRDADRRVANAPRPAR